MPRSSDNELDEIAEFDTFDEALAHVLSTAEPGCIVTIHEEHCELVDENTECTCEPMEWQTGAKA